MITVSARSRAKTTRERAEPTTMGHSAGDRREQYLLVAGTVVVCCSG